MEIILVVVMFLGFTIQGREIKQLKEQNSIISVKEKKARGDSLAADKKLVECKNKLDNSVTELTFCENEK